MVERGFVKRIRVLGYEIEVYCVDLGEYSAYCESFPYLEASAPTIAELREELLIKLSVESELDELWESEGISVDEEEEMN